MASLCLSGNLCSRVKKQPFAPLRPYSCPESSHSFLPVRSRAVGSALRRQERPAGGCPAPAPGRGPPLQPMPSLESQRLGQQVSQQAQQAQQQAERPWQRPPPPPVCDNLASLARPQALAWHSFWQNPLASRGSTVDSERRVTTTTDGESNCAPVRRMSRTSGGELSAARLIYGCGSKGPSRRQIDQGCQPSHMCTCTQYQTPAVSLPCSADNCCQPYRRRRRQLLHQVGQKACTQPNRS